MNFKDFSPEQLVGKLVLQEFGRSYDSHLGQAIRKITKVTKTTFKISGEHNEHRLYDLRDGRRKGLTGRMNMGQIDTCTLLTIEEAASLSAQWATQKEENAMRKLITEKLNTLTRWTVVID